MDDNRRAIFGQINYELDQNAIKWGVDKDDTQNAPNDWVAYISHHASRWFTGGFKPYKKAAVDTFRTQMIKVAALAISAIESLDRQRENGGKAFYESGE